MISTPYTLQIRKEGRQFILMLNLILILLIIIFSINFFFQFHPSILGWLGIEFHDFFRLFSIRISRSHGLGHRFDKFTEVYYDLFFLSFLLIDFFSISSIYIELFVTWASYFIFYDFPFIRLC
jgi:hypothetical protein